MKLMRRQFLQLVGAAATPDSRQSGDPRNCIAEKAYQRLTCNRDAPLTAVRLHQSRQKSLNQFGAKAV